MQCAQLQVFGFPVDDNFATVYAHKSHFGRLDRQGHCVLFGRSPESYRFSFALGQSEGKVVFIAEIESRIKSIAGESRVQDFGGKVSRFGISVMPDRSELMLSFVGVGAVVFPIGPYTDIYALMKVRQEHSCEILCLSLLGKMRLIPIEIRVSPLA